MNVPLSSCAAYRLKNLIRNVHMYDLNAGGVLLGEVAPTKIAAKCQQQQQMKFEEREARKGKERKGKERKFQTNFHRQTTQESRNRAR